MSDFLEKSKQLLGDDKINSYFDKTILFVGIGGVGGTALEALVRSGFNSFILIDNDVVDISNLNRQILFNSNDVGRLKVKCAKEHLLKINPNLKISFYNSKIGEMRLEDLNLCNIEFIVDAIDDVNGKLHLYEYAQKNNIPFISSLGMGNRIDPEKVTITTLNKTENDPLARKIRYMARQNKLDIKKIPVVFSTEIPLIKSSKPASIITVPSTAGLLIAKYVLTTIK